MVLEKCSTAPSAPRTRTRASTTAAIPFAPPVWVNRTIMVVMVPGPTIMGKVMG